VIYVDRNVREDRKITKGGLDSKNLDDEWESHHIAENVKLLSNVFGEGAWTLWPVASANPG
jgi:hypothetical protein